MAGPSAGMKCIFPFKLDGVTHNACTKHGGEDTEWEPWCSTKVDESGVHVNGGGHWGDCGPECPFEPGKHKIFFDICLNFIMHHGNCYKIEKVCKIIHFHVKH